VENSSLLQHYNLRLKFRLKSGFLYDFLAVLCVIDTSYCAEHLVRVFVSSLRATVEADIILQIIYHVVSKEVSYIFYITHGLIANIILH
jgi:hypothetical protein